MLFLWNLFEGVPKFYRDCFEQGVIDADRQWWNSSDTDIDLVALDESAQRLRLGSCKRSEVALVNDLGRFDGHVVRFLKAFPRFADWQVEKVAIAPSLRPEARRVIEAAGYLPQSLDDLTASLRPGGIAASP